MNSKKHSFTKENRLCARSDFALLKKQSTRLNTQTLQVYFAENTGTNYRIAFSVSTKIGNSVFRNRLKRILKDIFRRSPYKGSPLNALFVVKNRGSKNTVSEFIIKNDFNYLLKKINTRFEPSLKN